MNDGTVPILATLLDNHRKKIARDWAEKVRRLPDSHYSELPLDELLASTQRAMDAIIETHTTDTYAALENYLTDISLTRLRMGFNIAEVIEALLLCKETILPIIWETYSPRSPEEREATIQLDDCLRYLISCFGRLYAEAMQSSLKEQQRRISSMLTESQSLGRVTSALLEKIELAEVLDIVCTEAQELTGAKGSTVFLLDEERDGWLRVARSTGETKPDFIQMPVEGSVTGIAIRTSKPYLTNDPTNEVQAYIKGEDPTSLLAVPLRVKGSVIGVLDMVNKPGGFNQEDVRISSIFANHAAIALENARLYQQAQELAATQERQRLAHDLHDAVSQTLFSASLISDVLPKLWKSNPQAGEQKLAELRQLTRGALAEMRTLLLELRPAVLVDTDLGDLLRHLTNAFTGRTRIPATLKVTGQVDSLPNIKEVYYRVAQESLNNIIKHAEATQVSIHLQHSEEQTLMEIQDNGRGFDTQAVSPENLGLGIMRERAEAIDAQLKIQSDVGAGTCIKLLWKEGQA